ncbi:MAG: alanine racemase, partial [Rhodospirillaceae bacterium]|nr:alanine racemase [Rhodospirillaceae bacterium]
MSLYSRMAPRVTINLSSIRSNYKLLESKLSNSVLASVLKANAYGLGIERVALTLSKAGCNIFFVATLDEGIELRQILPKA